jgi:predicted RNA-binding protein
MTYWLCITNKESWTVVKQKKVWDVADRVKEHGAEITNV